MKPLLSIVICTYNRAEWLGRCLASLEPQCVDANRVETIVVDNNSTDETKRVVENFSTRLANFRYVFEETQGLSHARNRGIREALGEYIAYLDDDAVASSNWVNATIVFFETHPDASAVGGPFIPFSTVPIPPWFPSEYGRWRLEGGTRKIGPNEWISGLNMAFRKQALIDAGGFDPYLGMTGNTVSYGEDTNLLLGLQAGNHNVYYCDAMLVEHAILPHKLSLAWLLKSGFANGYDAKRTFDRQSGGVIAYLPTMAKAAARALIIMVSSKDACFKTRLYRAGSFFCWHLGYFKRLLGF
jgi:glycosyltransferase involved in cell wall biosynthesis